MKAIRRDRDVAALARSLEKEVRRKSRLFGHIKADPILEMGCGSGEVLSALSRVFPDAQLFGIDADERMLELATSKRIPRCTLYHSAAGEAVAVPNKCGTVIFCASIHEILSFSGLDEVKKALTNAHTYLTEGGRVIIWDGIKPEPQSIILPQNSPAFNRFRRFVMGFSFIAFDLEQISGDSYRVQFQAVAEFVSKRGKLSIPLELRETHFPLSEAEYVDVLKTAGFQMVAFEKDPLHDSEIRYLKAKLGMEGDFTQTAAYGLIVAEK